MAATRKIDSPMNKTKRFLESAAPPVPELFNTLKDTAAGSHVYGAKNI